ncbi:putative sugar transferase EpsL [Bacillus sp. T2.9-1]|uniref:sugar transferase n=1 Tax=Bacillus sp. T2.9-1 TaxID=3041163 RepID=UPI0024777BF5|nr:sugar transferase [Bacillus sp. T2.9-1]CAI9395039.1 putative sugar transferase EpsL [Bacillus sp. T2.9-1]
MNIGENSYQKSAVKRQSKLIYSVLKRGIDIIGSFILLVLTLPIFVTISFLYLFGENKGPVFFRQERIGLDGKTFYIYKFRSMIVNAEDKLRADKELYKKYIESSYKLEPEEDPRITKVGAILRSTSIDEIPQLLNVLKGEMSLVGPRPVIKEELVQYGNRKNEFLSVKPGITGYWQVNGRSSVDYPVRADLELFYVSKQSLLLDIKILLKTILIVVNRKGAY